MPHFQVHGPDGSIYEVDGPEGSDEAAAIAYVQANQKTIPSAPGPAAPHAAAPGLGAIVHGYLSTLQGAADTVGRIMSDPSGGALRGAIGGGIDAVTGQPQGQTLQATGAAAQTGVGQLLRMPADVANLWQHRLDPGVGDGGSLYEMSGQAAEPHTVADLVAGHPLPASHADDYQATPLAAQLIARGKAAAPAKPGLGSQIAAGAVGLAPYVAAGSIPLVGPGLAAGMMAGSGVTDQAEKAEALGKAGTPQAYNAEGNNAIVQGGLGAIPLGSLGEALIPQVVREAVTSLAQKAGVKSLPGWLASAQAELLPGVLAGAGMKAGSNLATRESGLDPKQALGEGVADSATNMGLIGAILGGVHNHAAPDVKLWHDPAPETPPPAAPGGALAVIPPIPVPTAPRPPTPVMPLPVGASPAPQPAAAPPPAPAKVAPTPVTPLAPAPTAPPAVPPPEQAKPVRSGIAPTVYAYHTVSDPIVGPNGNDDAPLTVRSWIDRLGRHMAEVEGTDRPADITAMIAAGFSLKRAIAQSFGRDTTGANVSELEPAPKPDLPPPEPVTATPLRPEPGLLADGEKLVSTPAGNQVRTRLELAEAADLKPATGDLQNRDRSKAGTDLQVSHIVNGFDPTRLGESAETDRGSPIVGPDNVVEAGNGRVAAINRVYDEHPDKVAAYHDHMRSLGLDPTGMTRPVIVRRRMTDMTPEQRVTFVHDSNKDAKLAMSTVETAKTDAHSLDPATMALYRGGDVEGQPNDGFRKAFMAKLTPEEQGAMVGEDGKMNNSGVARLESALMARAYEDTPVLSKLMEARDNNIRSIGGAMLDKSGQWASLRGDIDAGSVKPEFDITKQLVQAAKEVSDLRNKGGNVSDHLEQTDAFNPRDPITEKLIRLFYNKGLTRAAGRDAIADGLDKYIRRAGEQTTEPSMFGHDDTTPGSILDKILEERDGGNQAALFDKEDDNGNASEVRPERAPERNEGRDEGPAGEDERGQGQASDRTARDGGAGSGGEPGDGGGRGEAGDRLEDRSGITAGGDRGAYQEKFSKASFTDRASIYDSAIREAGHDPDKFRLLPTPRQKAILVKAFEKKFGIKVLIHGHLPDRMALDQLMDGYQNIQGMAHVLGVSNRAMGFGGKLSLKLLAKGNFLGVFDPNDNSIGLPGRSNSFAHEWGHAMDFHLLGEVTEAQARGLSGLIRSKGADFQPTNVREAFVRVLNTMFFDKTALAAKVMQLEKRIEATKAPKQKAALQAQIDNITKGNSRADAPSNYFRGAASLDKANADYWTSPTEMFARAFEAYVSNMVEASGFGTEFLGKGDENYSSTAEARFAKTFPHGAERDAIFDAIGNLMVQVNRETMLGVPAGEAAEAPGMDDLRKVTDFDRQVAGEPRGSQIKQQMDAISAATKRKAIETADRALDPKSGLARANDVVTWAFRSMSNKLKMIEARYGSSAVREIHDHLAFTPGEGRHVAETFTEDASHTINETMNRVSNILRAAKIDKLDLDTDTQRQLRDALISEPTKGTPANIVKAAAGLRTLFDKMFYDAKNAGLDIGYTVNGYLPRILDMPRISFNEPGFLTRASEAYEHVFNRDHGADEDDVLADDDKLKNFLAMAKHHGIEGHEEARAILKAIRKFEKDPENGGEPATELHAKLRELIAEMHPDVRSAWSDEAAHDWLQRMKTAGDWEQAGQSPAAGFTHGRELTPEADKILEDFYLQNPIEAVHSYVTHNARRVAYAKRFGPDGAKLKDIVDRMTAQGVSREDQNEVLGVLNSVCGRTSHPMSRSNQIGLSALHAYGTTRLLGRAVLTKLAEPMTAGMTSGDVREGFKTLARVIVGTRSMGGKERAELARALGHSLDSLSDHLIEANFGGQFGNATRFDRIGRQLMARTGLLALHRVQREQSMGSAHSYIDLLSGRVLEGDKAAFRGLQELGVKDPMTFARQIRDMGRMLNADELQTNFGRAYSLAMRRFGDMTIQEADQMSRPQAANNSVGRVIFGITSFASRFFNNVIARQVRMTKEIAKNDGVGAAASHVALGVLPAAMGMLAVQSIVTTLRSFLLDPGAWADHEKKGDLEEWLAGQAITRAFPLGVVDSMVIQPIAGLKYHHDLTSLLTGPAPGVILEDIGKMITPLVDAASPHSAHAVSHATKGNATTYDAVKAAYGLMMGPALSVMLGQVPGGVPLKAAAGFGMSMATSQGAGDAVATAIVGPKTRRATANPGGRANTREDARGGGRAATR